MKYLNSVMLVFVLVFYNSCTSDKGPLPTLAEAKCDSVVYYTEDIKPIITTKCAISGCHEPGFSSGDFTGYAGMKSRLENGLLKSRALEEQDMPPAGNTALTEEERIKVNCWINQGYPNNTSESNNDCSTTISYASVIAPIISANCSSVTVCHGTGASNGDYSGYSGLKTAADSGVLYDRVVTKNSLHTPPAVVNPPLTADQINKIDCWIQQGAANN